MSGPLQQIARNFDRRMRLRREMLAHLALDIPEDRAADLRHELRETLKACQSCILVEDCAAHLCNRIPGTPRFCIARTAFARIARAIGAQGAARYDA